MLHQQPSAFADMRPRQSRQPAYIVKAIDTRSQGAHRFEPQITLGKMFIRRLDVRRIAGDHRIAFADDGCQSVAQAEVDALQP